VCRGWGDEFYNGTLRILALFLTRVMRYRSLSWRMRQFGVPELVESVAWGSGCGGLLGRLMWGLVRD
jgi:hypothetical protein